MKLKSYNILFRLFSFLSDKSGGASVFVKYKLLLGTLILGVSSISAQSAKTKKQKENIIIAEDEIIEVTCYEVTYLPDIVMPKIQGYIFNDETGDPIHGASIRIKGTNTGTISYAEGNFSMDIDTFVNSVTLTFSALGFLDQDFVLHSLPEKAIEIRLKKSNYKGNSGFLMHDQLLQRVGLAYHDVEVKPICPVGDLSAFSAWIEEQIVCTQKMKKEKTEGQFFVNFSISNKGEVVEKRIINPPSKEFENEIFRIMSESPIWVPGKQNNQPIKTNISICIKVVYP